MQRTTSVVLALAVAVAAGCGEDTTQPYAAELESVRQATAGYQDVAAATAAGYTQDLTACMSDPAGAMGVHRGHPGRIDGTVELLRPEVVMFEPQASGGVELVGVEYLVPFTAWTAASPPSLMGQAFQRNETFGVWALHAWVHRANPNGVFASWNPDVSCPAPGPAPAGR